MSWQPFSLHFKQVYEEGFRYLDRCGEFMVHCVEDMNFISGEIQVTGAKIEKPELGIKAAVDSTDLTVTQEQPDDGDDFFEACEGLSKLATELFQPKGIWSNGFAYKAYWSLPSPEAALKASLTLGEKYETELGKMFGMVPSHKHMDYFFAGGSFELRVNLQPVTFERVGIARFNADFRASPQRKEQIIRLNKKADRIKTGVAHALMLELDLVEHEPPLPQTLRKHFDQLRKAQDTATKLFKIS